MIRRELCFMLSGLLYTWKAFVTKPLQLEAVTVEATNSYVHIASTEGPSESSRFTGSKN